MFCRSPLPLRVAIWQWVAIQYLSAPLPLITPLYFVTGRDEVRERVSGNLVMPKSWPVTLKLPRLTFPTLLIRQPMYTLLDMRRGYWELRRVEKTCDQSWGCAHFLPEFYRILHQNWVIKPQCCNYPIEFDKRNIWSLLLENLRYWRWTWNVHM